MDEAHSSVSIFFNIRIQRLEQSPGVIHPRSGADGNGFEHRGARGQEEDDENPNLSAPRARGKGIDPQHDHHRMQRLFSKNTDTLTVRLLTTLPISSPS